MRFTDIEQKTPYRTAKGIEQSLEQEQPELFTPQVRLSPVLEAIYDRWLCPVLRFADYTLERFWSGLDGEWLRLAGYEF